MADQNTPVVPQPPTMPTQGGNTGSPIAEDAAAVVAGQFQVIDFQGAAAEMDESLSYVKETRVDLDPDGTDQGITTLLTTIEAAKKAIRDLEVAHVEDTIEWKDSNGVLHEVLHRSQDEVGFDKQEKLYSAARQQFEEYFDRHIDWLTTQPR